MWPARPTSARARLAGVLLLAVAAPAWVSAQDDAAPVLERRVKAALLYRFISYVEWPESAFTKPETPFTIGIIGADVLAAELAEFAAGHTVLKRPLAVRRLRGADKAEDVQMLFVGRGEASQLGTILRAAPAHTLIVTESEGALRHGSVINFLVVNGQVRFEISLESARGRNIRLSSRLLSVAYHIQPVPP
jgi:uncharacterized protein DUF4154